MTFLAKLAILGLLATRCCALHNATKVISDAGSWAFSGKWYHIGTNSPTRDGAPVHFCNETGSSVSAIFTGVAIYLVSTFDTDRGLIHFELDGQSEGDRQAWVDQDGGAQCGVIYSRTGLENKQHTLKATVAGPGPHDDSQKFEITHFIYSIPDEGDGQQSSTNNPPPQQTSGGGGGSGSSPTINGNGNGNPTTQQSTTNPPAASQSQSSAPPSGSSNSAVVGPQSGSSTFTAPIGVATADITIDDPRIIWSPPGNWQNGGSDPSISSCSTGSRVTKSPGALAQFAFKGSAISVKTVSSSSSGLYNISIDGRAPDTKDGFSALSSAQCTPQASYSISGLADTEHVLVVTLTGRSNAAGSIGGTRLELAGFTYYGQDAISTTAYINTPPANNQAAIIGGSVGGILGALFLAGAGTFLFLRHRANNRTPTSLVGAAGFPPGETASLMTQTHRPSTAAGLSPNRVLADTQSGHFAFQPGTAYGPGSISDLSHQNPFSSHSSPHMPPSASTRTASPPTASSNSYQGLAAFAGAYGRPMTPATTSGTSGFELEGGRTGPLPPSSPPPAYGGTQSFVAPNSSYHAINHEGMVLH